MAFTISTVREAIAWSYANLARAHAALADGAPVYGRTHHIIRSKLFAGLKSGRMSMRSIFDDERIKLTAEQVCSYCGGKENLAVDHLISQIRGGRDSADNLILACRSCNSSKQGKDLLEWMRERGKFPSILVLRRYLKIVARYCEHEALMEMEVAALRGRNLPFEIACLPYDFPPLPTLRLRATAE